MKITAINGSARENGNTYILIEKVLQVLKKQNIETEIIQLAGENIKGCIGCRKCAQTLNALCSYEDNGFVNECITKMRQANGIILASPVYFANATPELMALITRAGVVARTNGDMLKRKIGAAIISVRRSGANHAFNSINHFFFISQMIVPGSNYWNMGIGKVIGDVNDDDEGLEIMNTLGENMAWLMKKLN